MKLLQIMKNIPLNFSVFNDNKGAAGGCFLFTKVLWSFVP